MNLTVSKAPRIRRGGRAGFSLVELLVVMAVVALLLSILLPALGSARDAAKQARAMSDLRQMLLGYGVYQSDYAGQVLWGYTPPTVGGVAVTVRAASGQVFGLPVADRYPWRLAPYVGDLWPILHSHHDVPPLPLSTDSGPDALLKAYALSLGPTFGINATYVGGHGDGVFAGFVTSGGVTRPNTGKHVVFRQDEVVRPSDLIVFADSKARNAGFSDLNQGLHFLTPPHASGHRWRAHPGGPTAADGGFDLLMPGHITGLPQGRYSAAAVTGFFDAHAALKTPAQLDNMRLWANRADAPDYDFDP